MTEQAITALTEAIVAMSSINYLVSLRVTLQLMSNINDILI